MKNLRILLIPPMYGGSLPSARYCERALVELGHMVEVFQAPDFYSAFGALRELRVGADRLEYLENGFLQLMSQAVMAKADSFEPDLVLALAQAPLSRQALKRFRKQGLKTAMWFVEDFRLFTYWRAFAPLYDFFAVIQKEPFISELGRIGQKNVLYLPLAADPSFHRPVELSGPDRRRLGSDLSFLGAGYPNRRVAFRQLLDFDLKIWGSDWEGDPALEKYVQRQGERIESEEAVRIFNSSKVNLNLHSSIRADKLVAGGDFVNPRTFELAACGAFQLVDQRALLPELFGPDEMAVFSDMNELREKIRHYLARPEERAELAERARRRVLADHTYERRMSGLLEFISGRVPGGLGRRERDDPFGPDFPPELRKELEELLDRLRLPRTVSFDDLAAEVRRSHGELSSIETAVLFLDEWRKQYGDKKK